VHPPLPLGIWAIATVAHFALTAVWVRRIRGRSASADEAWFAWILAATGSLATIVHVAASIGGVTLGRALLLLASSHVALGIATRSTTAAQTSAVFGQDFVGAGAGRWLERAGLAIFWAIAIGWTANASRSLVVTGSDAAHYHVPVAVNLALGADLFGLPPTPHLYPMTTSALAAWFILPLKDTLLVDLTMLLPFALLAGSAVWLFRLLTGASGLAWVTWPLLALFSTPLFRDSSLMSADLLFAAAFAALTAQLVAIIVGVRRRGDWLMAGLATGLLIGAKTTGLPTAGLLWALAALGDLVRLRSVPVRPNLGRVILTALGVGALAVGAGGIWLLRNWIVWGSPVGSGGLRVFGMEVFEGTPIEPTTYLSVLGDQVADPSYAVTDRLWHYADIWLGAWYLPLLIPLALVVVDVVRSRHAHAVAAQRLARIAAMTMVVGSLVPIAWLLRGAPWTSLEWTQGFSLRYVLPWLALLPILAATSAFPLRTPWFRRPLAPILAGGGAAALTLTLFLRSLPAGDLAPPRLAWLTSALGVVVAALVVPARRRLELAAAIVLSAALGTAWSARLAADDAAVRADPGNWNAAVSADARAIYRAAVRSEQPFGRECAARRFFLLTRFDEPLALQTPDLRNLIYYAARDIAVTARTTPLRFCDYVVASDPVLDTDKGQALVAALGGQLASRIGSSGPFVLLALR